MGRCGELGWRSGWVGSSYSGLEMVRGLRVVATTNLVIGICLGDYEVSDKVCGLRPGGGGDDGFLEFDSWAFGVAG